jgi:general secretion pathway protein A
MYESYFGFRKSPFSTIPDPGLLFLSPAHQRALSLMEYAVLARAGFCVITGAVGAGKTTLVRRLLQKVGQDLEIGLVSNTTCASFEELLQWILLAFNLEYKGKQKVELYDDFVAFLIEQYNKGRPVTLIIDEAQNLAPELLEQLRMLSNLNTERGQLLQTILIGQPNLSEVLRRPELVQLAQRISYDNFLGPLDSADLVGQYIRFRVAASGGSAILFGEDTYPLIWHATGGVPRLINLVCDTALVHGYAEQVKRISPQILEQVLKDREGGFAPVGRRDELATVAATMAISPPTFVAGPAVAGPAVASPRTTTATQTIPNATTPPPIPTATMPASVARSPTPQPPPTSRPKARSGRSTIERAILKIRGAQ